MRVSFSVLMIASAAMALASCDALTGDAQDEAAQESNGEDSAQGEEQSTPQAVVTSFDEEGVTPMAERVATIGLLNKRNNLSQDFEIRPGENVEAGPVILHLAACERTAPYEFPQETGAFVQVDVLERGEDSHTRVFSGWLFKDNPSLNIVEHPVYDVWVKDCAMRFPGEDPLPTPSASAAASQEGE